MPLLTFASCCPNEHRLVGGVASAVASSSAVAAADVSFTGGAPE